MFNYSICKFAALYKQQLPHLTTMYTVYVHSFIVAKHDMTQTEYAHECGLTFGSRGVHYPSLHLLVICGFWTF